MSGAAPSDCLRQDDFSNSEVVKWVVFFNGFSSDLRLYMFPTLFHIGPIAIQSYGLMLAIGFYIAVELMKRDGRKVGIDPEIISTFALGCLIVGVLGTRLLHIAMFSEEYSWKDPLGWIAVWKGGLVFHGAPPAMLAYLIWATRRYRVPFNQFMDIGVSYVVLAHAFGRIGCFWAGCCYGKPTTMPWGIHFPVGSPPCDRYADITASGTVCQAVHPTQLYEALLLVGLCAALLWLRKRVYPRTGFVLPAYLMGYGVIRFIVEMFRGDNNPMVWGVMSEQQLFCLVFFVGGAGLLAFMLHRDYRQSKDIMPCEDVFRT